MFKNNYYNLPSISCSNRIDDINLNDSKKACEGYNPANVYDTFFSDPKSDIPSKFSVLYKDYPKDGKVGDYQCSFDESSNTCSTVKNIMCSDKKPECVITSNSKDIIDTSSSSNVLPNKPCMQPNCGEDFIDQKSTKIKRIINNRTFFNCEKNIDGSCLGYTSNKTGVYTTNSYGFPVEHNTSNAPDQNSLYEKVYDNIRGDIINCPPNYVPYEYQKNTFKCCKGRVVGSHGKQTCNSIDRVNSQCSPVDPYFKNFLDSRKDSCEYPNGSKELYLKNSPKPLKFKTPDECRDWCADNRDCTGISYSSNAKGDNACLYYPKSITEYGNLIKKRDNFNLDFKRRYPIITDPKELHFPQPAALDPKDDTTYSSGKYCSDGVTLANSSRSNCMFPINKTSAVVPILGEDKYIGDPSVLTDGILSGYPFHDLGGGMSSDIINSNSGHSYINQLNSDIEEDFRNYNVEHFCNTNLEKCSDGIKFVILLTFAIIAGICLRHRLR